MRFSVLAGPHHALVDLETDGKGGFTVDIQSEEIGSGSGRGAVTGDHYIGVVAIKGHHPDLDATVVGSAIKGTLTLWPFPPLHFEGEAI